MRAWSLGSDLIPGRGSMHVGLISIGPVLENRKVLWYLFKKSIQIHMVPSSAFGFRSDIQADIVVGKSTLLMIIV